MSQAGASVAGAYDLLVSMSIITVAIPYLFMFAAYAKCARMEPVTGAWAPPGGRRTSLALAWIGQISTVIAIACSLAPNAGDPSPMVSFVKIVLSALVMLGWGLFFYWFADQKRKAQTTRSAIKTSSR